MKVVTCPESFGYRFGHLKWNDYFINNVIFLAGGITDCPDWQKEMIQRFKDTEMTVLINPRRENFDVNDKTASEFQINWEYHNLRKADAILFWFPYQTICPITLYELGVAAARDDKIFVGAHPAYPRLFDVNKQLELIRPEVKVHDNFESLVAEVKDWIHVRNE
jgi:hypothetical protein